MASVSQQHSQHGKPLIEQPTSRSAALRPAVENPVQQESIPLQDIGPEPRRQSLPNEHQYQAVPGDDEDEDISPIGAATNPDVIEPVTVPPVEQHHHTQVQEDPNWLPHALRWPWLLGITAVGALLLIVVIVVHSISIRNNGLVDSSEDSGLIFAWRFLPTLLAVSYVTMLMIVLDNVKRTEPFARLTKHDGGAGASISILKKPGTWWNALIDSLPRKKNENRFSGTMLCATLAYILGLLIVSPFSSALLVSKNFQSSSSTIFNKVHPTPDSILQPDLNTLEYFQTVGHMLQNVTTSPWISDQYTVIPFWPEQLGRPSGPLISGSTEIWSAESVIFQSELVCEVLKLASGPILANSTAETPVSLVSYQLRAESGCNYGFSLGADNDLKNAKQAHYWSNLSVINTEYRFSSPARFGGKEDDYRDKYKSNKLLLNHTSQCEPGEVLVLVPKPNTTVQVSGYLCRSTYYQATLPVNAILNANATIVTFDEAAFNSSRSPIASSSMNLTRFQDAFLGTAWQDFLISPNKTGRPLSGGPSNILAALYNFNISDMIADQDLIKKASEIKQRAFGQAVQASLEDIPDTKQIPGIKFTSKRRIVVVEAIAIILEIGLGLVTCLLALTLWFSRLSRRPLGLSQDPAFANTIASLVSSEPETSEQLRHVSHLSRSRIKKSLGHSTCELSNGDLRINNLTTPAQETGDETSPLDTANERPWRPKILGTWTLGALTLSLCSIIIAIAVLYWYSSHSGLSQSAFVYEIRIGSIQNSIGAVAPYSIIPTFLGVLIGLWWGGTEDVFRIAQPFVSMAQRPTASGRGSGLSYQSSYLAWAGARATFRSQWLLALVCIGAFFSQILTISMSALWSRVPTTTQTIVNISQPFQLREVPHLYEADVYKERPNGVILVNVFQNLTTNWMYGAALQLTLNASEPSWSHDGWSFVPVAIPTQYTAVGQRVSIGDVNSEIVLTQVTVEVPAIRGRLECSPVAQDLEAQYFTVPADITDWNVTSRPLSASTGYLLGCNGRGLINFDPDVTELETSCSYINGYTNVLTNDIPVTCCTSDADGLPTESTIGYWSPVVSKNGSDHNFTVKWIRGLAPEKYTDENFSPQLVWPEPPQLSMLKCNPIIESAKAKVTLDTATNQIRKYEILDQPSPYPLAWTDNFIPSGNDDGPARGSYTRNWTTSFGIMFTSALLGAAQIDFLGGCVDTSGAQCYEHENDRTFNFREPGLNLDYMSYSMLSLAQNNIEDVLELNNMAKLADKVFATFFQHFASSNVLLNGTGGWVYQRASEMLPANLPKSGAPAKVSSPAAETITAIISSPIEILEMSPIAVWLSIVILAWLIITTILILVLKNKYFSPLRRGVDTIADVAIMVAGSERYLELAREKGATGLRADKEFRTRLGWFRVSSGEIRWGIELADDERVEWVDGEGRNAK